MRISQALAADDDGEGGGKSGDGDRQRPSGYFAQRAPSFRSRRQFWELFTNCAVLKCMFAWRTRYPLSWVPN